MSHGPAAAEGAEAKKHPKDIIESP
jgi:hypothetical protein